MRLWPFGKRRKDLSRAEIDAVKRRQRRVELELRVVQARTNAYRRGR